MKKRFFAYAFAGLTLATGITSCSQDVEPALPNAGEQITANFRLNLPVEEATRSFGDGTKALQLTYVFYEKNASTGNLSIVGTVDNSKTFENLQTTVNVNLVTGKSYTMVCWAQDPDCAAYTFTAPATAAPTVDVTYDGVLQNDENRDAFYAAYDFTVNGPVNETVTLYRPFAQINVGTSDLDEASVVTSFGADAAKLRTSLSTKAYTNLNLISGAVSGQEEVNFGLAGIPSRTDEEFPYMPETYSYLSMDYILVPADKSLVDVTFNVYSTDDETTALNTVNVTDAPVQRNYRTNIFGQMLTTAGEFNVIIEPAFELPNYDVNANPYNPVEPKLNAAGDTYQISTPDEWVYLMQHGNNKKNIELANDIDFGNREVYSIRMGSQYTVNGNGHTMRNIKLVTEPGTGSSLYCGLFSHVGVNVKDLVIENVSADETIGYNLNGVKIDNVFMGVVIGGMQDGCEATITNVTVRNANLKGVQAIGTICGFQASSSNLEINNCTVENVTLTNYKVSMESGYVAGLVGKTLGTLSGSGNTLTDVTIDGLYSALRGAKTIAEIYAKDSRGNGEVTLTADWGEGCTIKKTSIGF